MAIENPWLMPQGIEDVLPEEALQLEALRRRLLDLYQSWGYELVMPPFIEFIDSLLADLGKDLDLQTFKVTDQLSGKTMGIRADMTPQVARIDSHILNRDVPVRLSYLGTVLHARNDEFAASRSPLQLGCELYGHSGIESDVEVIRLMLATLEQAGIQPVTLDLGHVGVFRGLMDQCGLDQSQENELFDILQRKSMPDLSKWIQGQQLDQALADMLLALAELNGGEEVLSTAKVALAKANKDVLDAIEYIQNTLSALKNTISDLHVHIDLAELHGYHYKTGLVFAAYETQTGREISRGGRYDNIGEAFGRSRPATGFSADLKTLSSIGEYQVTVPKSILAPANQNAALLQTVSDLRQQGEVVITALNDTQCNAEALGCDRVLIEDGSEWKVVKA